MEAENGNAPGPTCQRSDDGEEVTYSVELIIIDLDKKLPNSIPNNFACNNNVFFDKTFKKIKEAASGGEMSRIMLAIKSIMAKYKKLPSIIFDEIDTGVSGEISKKMGFIMKDLGEKIQTFSITHLPQIAAMGESHFKIYKSDVDGITKTMISRLNENDRIIEIAKMLEGNNASKSAYTHAKQLLN